MGSPRLGLQTLMGLRQRSLTLDRCGVAGGQHDSSTCECRKWAAIPDQAAKERITAGHGRVKAAKLLGIVAARPRCAMRRDLDHEVKAITQPI